MTTLVDERVGTVKSCWSDVRERVREVEPNFANLVDELSPDKTFPVYLVYLPYGQLKGDTVSSFIPMADGKIYRLTDPNLPKDITRHLGYGMHSSPLGMVLEKELEYFVDIPSEQMCIPWSVARPGRVFPYNRMLNRTNKRVYTPNGVLSVSSGVRTTFVLPSIGCATNFANVQRDYNIQDHAPKSLYEHWGVFKNIVNSPAASCDWRSCLMYFSQKWMDSLDKDPAWAKLKLYLNDTGREFFEYKINSLHYNMIYSFIQKNRNLKPNPYLADTASHLFAIAMGGAPGFAPACDEESLPVSAIQSSLLSSYGLSKYIPTIIKPETYMLESGESPIYYSLQYPSTLVFSPKSRNLSSTLSEIRELRHIVNIFCEELSVSGGVCFDTIIGDVARKIKFEYFHNKTDMHGIVNDSHELELFDPRFNVVKGYEANGNYGDFASDAKFFRGCIRMSERAGEG